MAMQATPVQAKPHGALPATAARAAAGAAGGFAAAVQNNQAQQAAAPPPAPPTLDAQVRAKTQANPDAAAAYDRLRTSPAFTALPAHSQDAVLHQAGNYPNAKSIGNLERLCQRPWFAAMGNDPVNGHADQQRAAKLVAYGSVSQPGDRTVMDNSLNHLLADGGPEVRFVDNGPGVSDAADANKRAPTATGAYAERVLGGGWAERLGMTEPAPFMQLTRNERVADDNPVTQNPGEHAANTGAWVHEMNHALNPMAEPRDAFQGMMNEHRASDTGYRAQRTASPDGVDPATGQPEVLMPQGQAANIIDRYIGPSVPPNTAYSYIRDGFQHDPVQQRTIVEYMAKHMDAQPDTSNYQVVSNAKHRAADYPPGTALIIEDPSHPDFQDAANIMYSGNYTKSPLTPEPEHQTAANNTDNR